MKYEALHFNKCKQPKLARFEGKDGFYSPKARFFNTFFKFCRLFCCCLSCCISYFVCFLIVLFCFVCTSDFVIAI